MSGPSQRWALSYSGSEGDNCVEVAIAPGAVHVRDSKDTRIQPPLLVSPAAWSAFTTHASHHDR
ncbi:DUF397 domain-containing protein [Streptomyces sp. PA03-6a]|nr:DUF397 domain-containing protein [Streptomyces sp. PA03-6a]